MRKNPAMSACVAKGLILFCRFAVLKEIFPEFYHPKNYYNMPTLRIKSDRNKAVTRDLLCEKYLILHEIIECCSDSGKTFLRKHIDVLTH